MLENVISTSFTPPGSRASIVAGEIATDETGKEFGSCLRSSVRLPLSGASFWLMRKNVLATPSGLEACMVTASGTTVSVVIGVGADVGTSDGAGVGDVVGIVELE